MKAVEALLTPALAAIHERGSVRAYTSDPVERYAIERLLDAAIWAPSARNAQPWAFVVVQDPVVLMCLETEAATLYFRDPRRTSCSRRPPSASARARSAWPDRCSTSPGRRPSSASRLDMCARFR